MDLTILIDCTKNDEAAIAENLAIFADALKEDLDSLSSAITSCNLQETHLIAHRIKGAAGFVGGAKVIESSEAIERAAEAADWSAIRHQWPRLMASGAQIRELIARRAA